MMAPMADRRGKRSNRATRGPDAPARSTGPAATDDEMRKALALFNAHLASEAEQQRQAKRVERATRAKDQAAARVRALDADTHATAEQRAEAAVAYRDALAAWERARNGEPEPAGATEAPHEPDELPGPPAQDDDDDASDTSAAADH
jgi:hypothetical protein